MVNTVPTSCFHSGLDGLPRGLVWLLRGCRLASRRAGPPQLPLTFGMGSLSPRHVAGVAVGMATSVQRYRKESLVVLVTPLRPLAPVLSGLAEVAQSSGGGHSVLASGHGSVCFPFPSALCTSGPLAGLCFLLFDRPKSSGLMPCPWPSLFVAFAFLRVCLSPVAAGPACSVWLGSPAMPCVEIWYPVPRSLPPGSWPSLSVRVFPGFAHFPTRQSAPVLLMLPQLLLPECQSFDQTGPSGQMQLGLWCVRLPWPPQEAAQL